MQFVASWKDDGLTSGISSALGWVLKFKNGLDETDKALKRIAAPRTFKAPQVGGGGGATPAPKAGGGFDKDAFLEKRKQAQLRDDAIAGLGLGISRQEKEKARDAKAEQREAEKRKSNSFGGGIASVFSGRFAGKALGVAAAAGMVGLLWKSVSAAKGLGLEFAKLTLGPMGLARANALIAVAGLRLQRMFLGIKTGPALAALSRFLSVFNTQTVAGKTIAATMQRWGNALLGVLAGAEPAASRFIDGLLVGFIRVETFVWNVRTALLPFTAMLGRAKAGIFGNNAAFGAGQAAAYAFATAVSAVTLGLTYMITKMVVMSAVSVGQFAVGAIRAAASLLTMGTAAFMAAIPVLALAAAFGSLYLAWNQLEKLRASWDENSLGQVFTAFGQSIGLVETADEKNARLDKAAGFNVSTGGGKYIAKDTTNAAKPEGRGAGGAFGDGMEAGMLASLPKLTAAGRQMVKAPSGAVKAEAQMHSPSKLFARHGRFMGAGVALGIMASAPAVQLAAREALVPDMGPLAARTAQFAPGALGSRGTAPPVERHLHLTIEGDVYGVEDLEARVRRVIAEDNHDTAKELGVA